MSTEQLATLRRDELLKQAEAAEAAARGKHDKRPEHPARWQGPKDAAIGSRDGRQPKRRKMAWTPEEDANILAAIRALGTQWSLIAQKLEHRTPDAVRNRWHHLQQSAAASAAGTMVLVNAEQPAAAPVPPTMPPPPLLPALALGEGPTATAVVLHNPTAGILVPAEVPSTRITGAAHGRSRWTTQEDETIEEGVKLHGLKWRKIAAMLPNRSDSSIRNRWMRLQEERAREAGESGATPRAGAMRALAAKEDSCTSTTGPPPPTALLAARVVDNGKADVQAAPAGSTELIVAALQDRRASAAAAAASPASALPRVAACGGGGEAPVDAASAGCGGVFAGGGSAGGAAGVGSPAASSPGGVLPVGAAPIARKCSQEPIAEVLATMAGGESGAVVLAPYGGGAMIPLGADPLDTKLASMQRAAQARLEAHEKGRLHDQARGG